MGIYLTSCALILKMEFQKFMSKISITIVKIYWLSKIKIFIEVNLLNQHPNYQNDLHVENSNFYDIISNNLSSSVISIASLYPINIYFGLNIKITGNVPNRHHSLTQKIGEYPPHEYWIYCSHD